MIYPSSGADESKVTPVPITIPLKGQGLNSKRKVRRHVRNPKIKTYQCDWCNYSTSKGISLQNHISSHHKKPREERSRKAAAKCKEKRYCCEYCQRDFAVRKVLANHINFVHLKKRENTCKECGRSFMSFECMQKHMRACSQAKSGPFCCQRCDITFADQSLLKSHEEIDHLSCERCGKWFTRRYLLRNHNREDCGTEADSEKSNMEVIRMEIGNQVDEGLTLRAI